MKTKDFTPEEILALKPGSLVKIRDHATKDSILKKGGKLVFQKNSERDKDEYRFGIQTELGVCYTYHSNDYELIDKLIPLDEKERAEVKRWFDKVYGFDKAEQEYSAKQIIEWFCEDFGLNFQEIQHYQLRIIKDLTQIDIFPQSKKYHNITTNERGQYKDLPKFLCKQFNIPIR